MSQLEQATTHALRVLAPNPGPMTLDGTNTWVLREPGRDDCVVVDPGPLDEGHLARVAGHGPVSLVLLTHSHPDHAAGAHRFHELTGAPVRALDPTRVLGGEGLVDGDVVTAAGVEVRVVTTPGHSSDSLCFVLPADAAVLTGDTVLGRGTTVVAHPDGRLAPYLWSLRRLRALAHDGISVVLPGHGPVLDDAAGVLDGYLSHREERLAQIRAAIDAGDRTAREVVERVYADVDEALWGAAELSVRAQLDFLQGRE